MTPGIAPDKLPMDDPVGGVTGNLGVVPGTAGGLVPKREPGTTLESGVAGTSVLGSGLGLRPNAPGLIPANRLGVAIAVGLVASCTLNAVLGFGAVPLSEKPVQADVGAGARAAASVPKAEEGLLRGTPFVVNSGGVPGLATIGDAGLALTEADFSPLTSSSSPPDTGAFARGELRSGRVLGLPRLMLELGDGDGEREGDGSVGVGS